LGAGLNRGVAVRRVLGIALVVMSAWVALSGVAVAKGDLAATAQSIGDGFVTSLMPAADSTTGICDVKTQSGFFAKKQSYLASCGTADGSFQAFYIIDVNHKSLNSNSPYLKTQLNTFCSTGHAYSVGVKQKLVAVFAGVGEPVTGNAAAVAKDMADSLGSDIKSSTPGFVKPFKLC
jgi:hypothetical protein